MAFTKLGTLTPLVAAIQAQAQLGIPDAPAGNAYITPITNVSPDLTTAIRQESIAIQAQGGLQYAPIVDTHEDIFGELLTGAKILAGFVGAPFTGGTSLISSLSGLNTLRQQDLRPIQPLYGTGFTPTKGLAMWPFDDTTDLADPGIFGGNTQVDWGGLLNTGVGFATKFLQTQSAPMTSLAGAVPAVVAGGGALMTRAGMIRILAQKLAAQGITWQAAKAGLRKFGPSFLSGAGLAAGELALLSREAMKHHRRMNMCNARALRRASRRLSAFHNFYKKTCSLPIVRHRRKSCK
jgi:hypothetical protein